jgi:hypothetical protein
LSYHSDLTQGKQGTIQKYGTHDYTIELSKYKALKTYALEYPVLTTQKDNTGNKIESVTVYDWDYLVLNWIPNKDIQYQVTHKIIHPFRDSDILFQSSVMDDSQKAIELFNSMVNN